MRLENEAGQGELALKLRVPGWTDASRAKITVNGEPWKECSQDVKNSSGVGELGKSHQSVIFFQYYGPFWRHCVLHFCSKFKYESGNNAKIFHSIG